MLMVFFLQLLPTALDGIREHWNTQYIRRSRHDTFNGRPDSLNYLPELHGVANEQFLLPVGEREREYVRSHIIESDYHNIYQDYFVYVSTTCDLPQLTNWNEALDLYNTLLHYLYSEND